MIIGIDLGTTNSLVSYFTNKGPVIIKNRLGESLTPSIVSIGENDEIFVGKIAKERKITHPELTAEVFKRSMGSKKMFKIGEKNFSAEELSSFVIRSLKEDAEEFLGVEIKEAIISVPAYFNDSQRKATQRAGEMAGLKIERMINEPTAAAIAYGLHEKKLNTKFLVFDLGGGTFDVSILEIYKNIMEVRAVAGDNFLGGEDFTEAIALIFLKENNIDYTTLSLSELAHIKKQAEGCKIALNLESQVTMKCKIRGEVIESVITYAEYEKACTVLLGKIRKPIERILRDAAIKIKDVDEIILIGGGTKLKIVRSFVAKLFSRLPNTRINPDETVALGAGIQGAMKERNEEIKDIVLTDVCPYTLGTDVSVKREGKGYESGYFCPIIERNTVIPVSRTETLWTVYDNQSKLKVEILQGESRLARNNIYLGEIVVDVPKRKAGEEAIEVTYTYDINSILEVEVKVVSTGVKKRIVIQNEDCTMTEEEIEERLKTLSEIKIHPREMEENKLLLARGERLYEESIGDIRRIIQINLEKFERVLDRQNKNEVESFRKELKEFFDEIDADF